ncbi:MAG: hypothetical protein HW407_2189 [Bacteroidetes bacterium]|nr:hypothetical protein [Bacteroidota bacterium]
MQAEAKRRRAPATSSKEESRLVKARRDFLFYPGILQSYPIFSLKSMSVCFSLTAIVVLESDAVLTSDI